MAKPGFRPCWRRKSLVNPPPEVEAESRQATALACPHNGFHHIVMHASAERRMGVKGHDNTFLRRRFISQKTLEATSRAREFYVLFIKHVVSWADFLPILSLGRFGQKIVRSSSRWKQPRGGVAA